MICPKCKENKPNSNFYFNSSRGSFGGYCKSCHSSYYKNHYADRADFVRNLKDNPCIDCGNKYHYSAMQFDHIASDKVADVSRLLSSHSDMTIVVEEIKKCDLVCANCHAIRTWKRRNNIPL